MQVPEQNINIRIGDTVPLELYQNSQTDLRRATHKAAMLRECMSRMVLRDHCEAITEDKAREFHVNAGFRTCTTTLEEYYEDYRNKQVCKNETNLRGRPRSTSWDLHD